MGHLTTPQRAVFVSRILKSEEMPRFRPDVNRQLFTMIRRDAVE
jgi:hypothetical protein